MKISQLISELQIMKDNLGDVECVQYTTNWSGNEILTTVETVDAKPFKKHFAVLLDWRTG